MCTLFLFKYQVATRTHLLQKSSVDRTLDPDLEELLLATHYTHMLLTCRKHNLKALTAKIAVTLMRYADIIPADKLCYAAGMACREIEQQQNLAFMLLSRCLLLAMPSLRPTLRAS
jgi:hypothetical protein